MRKTLIILGILALAGGGVFAAQRLSKKETVYGGVSKEQLAQAAAILERDSDGDGLKDWEEELWKTDPKNPDTDKDGTPDGEEIKAGRDPLTPGPNDKLDQETIEKKTTLGKPEWTDTDRLSREFFEKLLLLKQSGKSLTEEESQKLLADIIAHYPPEPQKKIWAKNDITLSHGDDAASYRAYGNAIGDVILKYRDNGGENELTIYEQALTNEDENYLATLQTRAKRYEDMLNAIKTIPAPPGLADVHLAMLNALEGLKESVEGMTLAMKDPVRSLGPTGAYPHAIDALIDASDRLARALTEKGVRFEKEETGYILLK